MSEPDPKATRDQAREFVRDAIAGIDHGDVLDHMLESASYAHLRVGDEDQDVATLDPIAAEVCTEARRAVLSWPDEQPQDERDGDVRAVRALTIAASRMLGRWAEADDDVRRELWTALHDRADDVHDRYRERYAELDARAAKDGAQ